VVADLVPRLHLIAAQQHPLNASKSSAVETSPAAPSWNVELFTWRAVKAHFSPVIDEVAGAHERVTLTTNGSPVDVIFAVEDLDSLLETLEIPSDRTAVADVREAELQMMQGQIVTEEQVRAAVSDRRPRATSVHRPPALRGRARDGTAKSVGMTVRGWKFTSPSRGPGRAR
jgi:prevent-host-death family protein